MSVSYSPLGCSSSQPFLSSNSDLDGDLPYKRDDLVGERVRQPCGRDQTDHPKERHPDRPSDLRNVKLCVTWMCMKNKIRIQMTAADIDGHEVRLLRPRQDMAQRDRAGLVNK